MCKGTFRDSILKLHGSERLVLVIIYMPALYSLTTTAEAMINYLKGCLFSMALFTNSYDGDNDDDKPQQQDEKG